MLYEHLFLLILAHGFQIFFCTQPTRFTFTQSNIFFIADYFRWGINVNMAKIIERIERIIEGNFLKVYNNTVNAAHD